MSNETPYIPIGGVISVIKIDETNKNTGVQSYGKSTGIKDLLKKIPNDPSEDLFMNNDTELN